jgi:hypothetical protein
MVQQRLLNTGVIRGAGGPPVGLAPPETDSALTPTMRGAKGTQGQPNQTRAARSWRPVTSFLQYLAIETSIIW